MINDNVFTIGGVYNFNVYPVALLGNVFHGVTIKAIMDCDTANATGVDTAAMHVSVYPQLPPGTPNDPKGYDYVKVSMPGTGETTIIGLAWIDPTTVTLVESQTVIVTIPNVSASSIPRILNALAQNGFNGATASIK